MTVRTTQPESQQPKHQTQAEQYATIIVTGDQDAIDEAAEAAAGEISVYHQVSTSEVYKVLEFPDGSLYDCSDGEVAIDMADFLETVSTVNEAGAEILEFVEPVPKRAHSTSTGWILVAGVVEKSPFAPTIDLPLKLTGMRRDGEPYLMGSSDFHEEPEDEAPIAYTKELSGLVGCRVLVRCCVDEFHEERATARGNPYHVEVQYLDCPKVMAVGGEEGDLVDDDEIPKFNEIIEACYQ